MVDGLELDERYVNSPSRQERLGVEARVADLGPCGLRRRRGRTRTPLLHADAGHRRPGRKGPGEVRSDEAHRHDHRQRRKLQRDAHAGCNRERAALRQGCLAAHGLHGRADPQGRCDQDASPTSGGRTSSTAARSRPRGSNSSAAPRRIVLEKTKGQRRHGRLESRSARTSIRRKPTIC